MKRYKRIPFVSRCHFSCIGLRDKQDICGPDTILLGYYNDANIWTTLEPSIGVVSACLPTLRPLTQFVSLQFTRKPKDSQRGIQLDSFGTKAKGSKLSNQHTWIDDDLNFQPKNQASNKIAISSTKHEPDAERDERLLPGILVSQDVDVERASK